MELQQFKADDDRPVREIDGEAVVADLGQAVDATVDVVGDVAIVVVDDAEGEEFELELPEPATGAFIRNGVLTIELESDR